MSELICGRIAAGENYSLTRDSHVTKKGFEKNYTLNTNQTIDYGVLAEEGTFVMQWQDGYWGEDRDGW